MAWPPSLPYPAQSSTWRRPLSAARCARAASAKPARPAIRPAPPVAAASLRRSSRLILRSNRSRPSSMAFLSFPSLIAGRTDDPHHFGPVPADVHDAMRCGASVVDAVAALELVEVAAELELHCPGQHDEHLFRVAVRVR